MEMMGNIFNFCNCMVESIILLLLWKLLVKDRFPFYKYLLAFLTLCAVSVLVVMINAVSLVIIPVNFLLIAVSFYTVFRKMGLKTVFAHTAFAFLLLLYVQAIILCFIPRNLLGANTGNLFVNSLTLLIAVLLSVLSRKYHWAVFYKQNQKMMWLYIVALCVPEIIIMQLFSSAMTPMESPIMISLILLQILYSVLLLFAFFIHNRKAEKRQLQVTQMSIKTLNEFLDDSRKRAHDFNKHIRYIRSVVNTQSTQPELIENVNAYCADILEFTEKEEVLLQLDDPMFRALFSGRQVQAKAMDIRFDVMATAVLPEFPVANYQLVDIFGNLMDNAFECVSEQQTDRWIRVELRVTPLADGCFEHLLCVQNPYTYLDFEALLTQKGYTTKRGQHAGIGLQNVRKIIADTDGDLLLNSDDNVFTVKVIYRTLRE